MRVKISVFVLSQYSVDIRNALGGAGAGVIGEYSYCSFTVTGIGRFVPSKNANPHIGKAHILEEVDEERIEVVCDRTKAKEAIRLMKEVHPYDEVAFDIVLLIEESEL